MALVITGTDAFSSYVRPSVQYYNVTMVYSSEKVEYYTLDGIPIPIALSDQCSTIDGINIKGIHKMFGTDC